jgi:hypothetical protein
MTGICTNALRLLIRIRWTRKKHYFYYLITFYRPLRVFKYNWKFSFFKYRFFCPKKMFFSKKWIQQFLVNFMGYSNQKAEKKSLSRSGVISILVLKKSEKSKYLSKYWVSWPDIMLDRKRIKIYTIKKKKKKSDDPSLR